MGIRAGLLVSLLLLAGGEGAARSAAPEDDDAFVGLIEPSRVVTLSMEADGRLSDVSVDRGDRVEPGQLIAELDSSLEQVTARIAQERAEQRASLESARVRHQQLLAKRERAAALETKGVITPEQREDAEWEERLAHWAVVQVEEQLRVSALELERAREVLARRRLISPVSGIVTERLVASGEHVRVSDGTPVVRVVVLDPLHVEVIVPATELGRLRVGQTAWVELEDGPPRPPLEATIDVIDSVVDAASGTFGVRLTAPNPDSVIAAGLRCRVRFSQDE